MVKPVSRPLSQYSLDALALLGQLLREARLSKAMTTMDLAARAGISRALLQRMNEVPCVLINDGFVLPREAFVFVLNLAKVDPVAQQFEKVLLVDGPALTELALLCLPCLGGPPLDFQFTHDLCGRAMLSIS